MSLDDLLSPDKGRRKRKRRLFDITPDAVALVDRAANRRRFQVIKKEEMRMLPNLEHGLDGQMFTDLSGELTRAATTLEKLTAAIESVTKGEGALDQLDSAIAEAESLSTFLKKANRSTPAQVMILSDMGKSALKLADKIYKGENTLATEEIVSLIQFLKELDPSMSISVFVPDAKGASDELLSLSKSLSSFLSGLGDSDGLNENQVDGFSVLCADLEKAMAKVGCVSQDVGEFTYANPLEMMTIFKKAGDALVKQSASISETILKQSTQTEAKSGLLELRKALFALKENCPMQITKAAGTFAKTLREVAERSMSLANKAAAAGFDRAKGARELKTLVTLLQGLSEKYPAVRKMEDVDIRDQKEVLNAEAKLDDLEKDVDTFIEEKKGVSTGAGTPASGTVPAVGTTPAAPAGAAVAGTTTGTTGVAGASTGTTGATGTEAGAGTTGTTGTQGEGMTQIQSVEKGLVEVATSLESIIQSIKEGKLEGEKITEELVKVMAACQKSSPEPKYPELQKKLDESIDKLTELTKNYEALRDTVKKARANVTLPSHTSPSVRDEEKWLFPMNYNDPEYLAACAARDKKE